MVFVAADEWMQPPAPSPITLTGTEDEGRKVKGTLFKNGEPPL